MIEFLNLQKVNQPYQQQIKDAIAQVIDSGCYLLGEALSLFEKNLSNYIGSDYALGVSNGLNALHIIFMAYKELGLLKPGDEVLVPANTYIATVMAIRENGLKPVLVEPDLLTYNIDSRQLGKSISHRTKAIVLVHLYGQISWDEEIQHIIEHHGLICIEDNAQAFGAQWRNKKSGNLGDAAAFSFYPTKNLGALADGGAITTDNKELAEVARALRNYGSLQKHQFHYEGINARLSEIQAAVLNVKISYVDEMNQKRRDLANGYNNAIKNSEVKLPLLPSEPSNHVWHLYVVRCNTRESLRKHLAAHQIETAIHYPIPPHRQKAFKDLNNLSLPITEQIHDEVISLPLNPELTPSEVHYISEVINNYAV